MLALLVLLQLAGFAFDSSSTLNDRAKAWLSQQPDSTIYYANIALEAAFSESDTFQLALANKYLGIAHFYKESFDSARKYYHISFELFQSINQPAEAAKICNNLGLTYKEEMQYDSALRYYKAGLTINYEAGELSNNTALNHNISTILIELEYYEEAKKYLISNLELVNDNPSSRINTNINLGVAYKGMNQIDSAIFYYESAYETSKIYNYPYGEGITCLNIGNLYLKKEALNRAEKYLLEASTIFEKINYTIGSINAKLSLGNLYIRNGAYDNSLTILKEVLILAEQAGQQQVKKATLFNLAITEKRLNHPEKSTYYLRQYRAFADELYELNSQNELTQQLAESEEINIAIKDLEVSNLLAKTQIEAQLSQNKLERNQLLLMSSSVAGLLILLILINKYASNRIREQQTLKERLIKLEDQKLELLKTQLSPHFIFNAFNSIHTLITNHDSAKATQFLIALDQLMNFQIFSSAKTFVPIEEELNFNKKYIEIEELRFKDKFDIVWHITDELATDSIPPLLIQPFLENAIKYALLTSNNHLVVTVKKYADHYAHIRLIDNGPGFQKDKQKEKRKSRGIELIQERLLLLDKNSPPLAKVEIQNLGDHTPQISGTQVDIITPIAI